MSFIFKYIIKWIKGTIMNNKLDSLFISKEKSQIIKSDVVKCHGISIDNSTSCCEQKMLFTSKELPSDS